MYVCVCVSVFVCVRVRARVRAACVYACARVCVLCVKLLHLCEISSNNLKQKHRQRLLLNENIEKISNPRTNSFLFVF